LTEPSLRLPGHCARRARQAAKSATAWPACGCRKVERRPDAVPCRWLLSRCARGRRQAAKSVAKKVDKEVKKSGFSLPNPFAAKKVDKEVKKSGFSLPNPFAK